MPDTNMPYVRMSRVTTRRNSLRPLNCPLEPELIVAEFAGELPPEVAVAVREHIAVCATCGPRAKALHAPYELLASLGQEPAPYVPDLRETVRLRVRATRFLVGPLRALAGLGRGGLITLSCVVAVAMVALLITTTFFAFGAQTAPRSTNSVTNAPVAAPRGVLYAETGKLVTVMDGSNRAWQVAEIIAVNERNGVVIHSLPESSQALQVAGAGSLPIGVVVGSHVIVELTPPEQGAQAIVGFSPTSGQVIFIHRLSLPSGVQADALALAPDGSVVYVGLSVAHVEQAAPRVLVFSTQSGSLLRTLAPSFTTTIPMPPPPGSLPASGFPSVTPILHAAGFPVRQAINGALAISPNGKWLFDTLWLTDTHGNRYIVIRRINTQTGGTERELAIKGTFGETQLAASKSLSQPAVYIVTGSPAAECYVIDAGDQGPTLNGSIPLGGPSIPEGAQVNFNESLSISAAADGARLYVAQDATANNGQIVSHTVWLIDTLGMGVIASRDEESAAGQVFANSFTGMSSKMMVLRNGQALVLPPNLAGDPVTWLSLSDGRPVVALLATEP